MSLVKGRVTCKVLFLNSLENPDYGLLHLKAFELFRVLQNRIVLTAAGYLYCTNLKKLAENTKSF